MHMQGQEGTNSGSGIDLLGRPPVAKQVHINWSSLDWQVPIDAMLARDGELHLRKTVISYCRE